jgi:hypothetical protein
MLNQLLGFLSCDGLQCKPKDFWDPFSGVRFPSTDDWAKTLNNFDLLGGAGGAVDEWAGLLSMYGGQETIFKDCRETIINPQTQSDVGSLPLGTKWYYCIPPTITIYGDGIGARAQAVVEPTLGSILTIKVLDPGKYYTKDPSVSIVDNTNFGKGAQAKAKINSSGNIESIYIIDSGSGYCQTDLNLTNIETTTTLETETPTVLTTTTPGIGRTTLGISTTPVGIVTNIVVERPGFGYTSGDTIVVGNCSYSPVLTNNGSIIGVSSVSACSFQFKVNPTITINTNTGQGALLYPVLEYVPQYVVDNPSAQVGLGTDQIVNVVQCV